MEEKVDVDVIHEISRLTLGIIPFKNIKTDGPTDRTVKHGLSFHRFCFFPL